MPSSGFALEPNTNFPMSTKKTVKKEEFVIDSEKAAQAAKVIGAMADYIEKRVEDFAKAGLHVKQQQARSDADMLRRLGGYFVEEAK